MSALGIDEIEELLDEIRIRVLRANRDGTLDQLLSSMGIHDLIEAQVLQENKNGKIVVLGASEVDAAHLLNIAMKYGLDKNRFEFCIDYDSLQKYNFHKLQYSDKYRLILVGPMPHSTAGKLDSSSAIAEMEKHPEMYPRIVRMSSGSSLKISKSGFKQVIENMLHEGYL